MATNTSLRAAAALLTRAEADEAEAAAEHELLRIAGTFGRDVAAAEDFHQNFYCGYRSKVAALRAWQAKREGN